MLPWCAGYLALAVMLEQAHGERKLLEGKAGEQVMVELFMHPETKRWSLLSRQANGIGCVLATGSDLALAGETPKPPPVEREN